MKTKVSKSEKLIN